MSTPQSRLSPGFFRQCRLWHGYLSAFAFGALLFFALTGIALNHPDWFADSQARNTSTQLMLAASQLQELRQTRSPARLLARMVEGRVPLYGVYQDGEADGGQLYVRMRGARGSSDIRANLQDGAIVVLSQRATAVGFLNALHRGEQAGAAWRVFIDVAAAILIVLSLVGYAIFFSMSTRFSTALLITGASLIAIVLFCVVAVR